MEIDLRVFENGWSIGRNLYEYLLQSLGEDSKILEFGSGAGSSELGKIFDIQCVEHDPQFVNLYPNIDYIYAPIVGNWYDHQCLKSIKPHTCILIDGPPGHIGRGGILEYIHNLNTNALIIVDDINREKDLELFKNLCNKLNKNQMICQDNNKQFGVLI